MVKLLPLFLLLGCSVKLPDAAKPTDPHYVFLWAFNAEKGAISRGDIDIPCAHPRTLTMCAVPCGNLADITAKLNQLEDTLEANNICSEESKGAAKEMAEAVELTNFQVWGFHHENPEIFRADQTISCHDPLLFDFCALSCNSLAYLANKAQRLKTILLTSENCSFSLLSNGDIEKEEFETAVEMIKSIELELQYMEKQSWIRQH